MAIHEKMFPLDMSRLVVSPAFSTVVTIGKSGTESRNQTWAHPRRSYNAAFAVQSLADLQSLQNFHYSVRGSLIAFLIQDYSDYTVSSWTEFAETATGASQQFQLIKKYEDANLNTYTRTIYFPASDSVSLQDNGSPVSSANFTVNTTTGIVTYTASAPSTTVEFKITTFYVAVRFEQDQLPGDLFAYYLGSSAWGLAEIPEIPLLEVRYETVSSTPPAYVYFGADQVYFGADAVAFG